jgi:hypothetical protein
MDNFIVSLDSLKDTIKFLKKNGKSDPEEAHILLTAATKETIKFLATTKMPKYVMQEYLILLNELQEVDFPRWYA